MGPTGRLDVLRKRSVSTEPPLRAQSLDSLNLHRRKFSNLGTVLSVKESQIEGVKKNFCTGSMCNLC